MDLTSYPWKPATARAETGRVVWIIECHPKKIYPQSYSIHAGTVEVPQGHSEWRVSQGDEAGSGWASWYPAIEGSTADEQFIAWAYVEDFTPAPNVLPIPPKVSRLAAMHLKMFRIFPNFYGGAKHHFGQPNEVWVAQRELGLALKWGAENGVSEPMLLEPPPGGWDENYDPSEE